MTPTIRHVRTQAKRYNRQCLQWEGVIPSTPTFIMKIVWDERTKKVTATARGIVA